MDALDITGDALPHPEWNDTIRPRSEPRQSEQLMWRVSLVALAVGRAQRGLRVSTFSGSDPKREDGRRLPVEYMGAAGPGLGARRGDWEEFDASECDEARACVSEVLPIGRCS